MINLLPRMIDPYPILFRDEQTTENDIGPMGGNICEYWLNNDAILRVATAYYSPHDSKVLWAVLLTKEERPYFKRPLY